MKRLLAIVALSLAAQAQQPAVFDVVSIRRNLSTDSNTHIDLAGGTLTLTNASAKTLIRNAYGILAFQLAEEPRWLDTEMYNIVAKTNGNEKISSGQFKPLLQSLLADKFQLKVHWETREGSVYALLVDKAGPKFQENSQAQEPGINTQKTSGRARMKGTAEPISILAGNLGNQLGRTVLDKTDLHSVYDWVLEWNPDPAVESTLPSLLTAVKEQLGLRLDPQKGPMEVLVIDRIEKPVEN